MKITDEAVLAATQVIRAHDNEQWGEDCGDEPYTELVNNILTAALPHLPAGCKIKQLEWEEGSKGLAVRKFFTTNRMYSITECHGGSFIVETDNSSKSLGGSGNLKAAKQLAQADFERRVRECIVCTLTNEGAKMDTKELIQALSRLAGNRHSDGISSLVSAGDRSTIINTCHDLIVALKTSDTVDVAEVRRKVLEGGVFDILSDIKPHLEAWRAALIMAERAAVTSPPDIDDKAYWRHEIKALEDISDKLSALPAEPSQGEQWQPTHRHAKRGAEYKLIGTGKMQAEKWQVSQDGIDQSIDMQEVAIYRGDDEQLWVRPIAEFNDGRFERLPAAPTTEAGQ